MYWPDCGSHPRVFRISDLLISLGQSSEMKASASLLLLTAFPRPQDASPCQCGHSSGKADADHWQGDLREGNLGRSTKPRKCQLQAQLQAAHASSSRIN